MVQSHDAAEAVSIVTSEVVIVFAFGDRAENLHLEAPAGEWSLVFSSRDKEWNGPDENAASRVLPSNRVLNLAGPGAWLYRRAG